MNQTPEKNKEDQIIALLKKINDKLAWFVLLSFLWLLGSVLSFIVG